MFHLLIVDDEILAARGIEIGIDWKKLGISQVSIAHNIRLAKEIFANQTIDIMICDIEMPMGSGLELLQWLNEQNSPVKSLLLTCHSDFSYAQKAIQLGSLDYLVKPVRYENLETIIAAVIDKIKEERKKLAFTETLKTYYQLWSKHQPLIIERFWLDLIDQNTSLTLQEIKSVLAEKNLPFHETMQFIPIFITVQKWHKELSIRDEKIMEYAIRNAIEHMIFNGDDLHGQVVQVKNGSVLAIIDLEEAATPDWEQLSKNCAQLVSSCNEYFYCDLSCYVGEIVPITHVNNTVEALIKMDARNITYTNRVFSLSINKELSITMKYPEIGYWIKLLKESSKEELLSEIDKFVETIKREGFSVEMLHELYQDFLQMVYYVLQLKNLQAKRIISGFVSPESAVAATRSIDNFRAWTHQMVNTAIDFIHSVEEAYTVVDRVKRYIIENLDKGLTREDIAEYVNLNGDYLTRLFKKSTGQAISEFLLDMRFNYAKEQLIMSDVTVSQIATSIGYSNFSHFSSMFKRITGMNPLDFRKEHRK